MSILKELIDFLAKKGGFNGIFIRHWKPKLICLVLAILVWMWVEFRYVRQSDEWTKDGDVHLSVPGPDYLPSYP